MTRKVLDCFYTAEYVGSSPTLCTEQLGYGVIGSTTAFDAVCSGSSPDTPASNIEDCQSGLMKLLAKESGVNSPRGFESYIFCQYM